MSFLLNCEDLQFCLKVSQKKAYNAHLLPGCLSLLNSHHVACPGKLIGTLGAICVIDPIT